MKKSVFLLAVLLCAGPVSSVAQFLRGQTPSAGTRRLLGVPQATPSIQVASMLNSASYGTATPGGLASVFGTFPIPASGAGSATSLPLPRVLDGLSVQLGGLGAPLTYAGPSQANVQVPWELTGESTVQLSATANGQTSLALSVNLAPYAPGIFTTNAAGSGQGVVTDSTTGKIVDSSNPAIAGQTYLVIYCTGLGPVTNQPATGVATPASPLSWSATPTVQIGGVSVPVLFSGLTPAFVGLYQINVQTPAGLQPGSAVPVVVSIGGATSNSVTIAVQAPAAGPAIYSLSPSYASAGGADFTLTVTGAGFVSGSVVYWNATALATSYVDATHVKATVPAAVIAQAGSASVTVANQNTVPSGPVTFAIQSSTQNGMIVTVAGTGAAGYSGDGGTAGSAALSQPYGLAVDAAGNLYIADTNNNVIRKVTGSGSITTVAGSGASGNAGDGGLAIKAALNQPRGVAVDSAGNLYIADTSNNAIRRVSADGAISSVATSAYLNAPGGIAVDGAGNLFIADTGNNLIRKLATDGTISTVAGSGASGYTGDGGPAISAQMQSPAAVAVDAAGNIYIADTNSDAVRKVTLDGNISTVPGSTVEQPQGVAVDSAGNVYVATHNNMVRRITQAGIVSTIAGDAFSGYSGDGSTASGAELSAPSGLALDTFGNLYIADTGNSVVRRVYAVASIPAPAVTSSVLAAGIDGGLYRVNPTAGASQLVGAMPVIMSDIAAYQKVLYAISMYSANGSVLYRIDAGTGNGSPIGTGSGVTLNALVFSSAGVLYAAGGNSLYTISTTTGVATLVGSGSYYSSGDLEFDSAGNLYLSSYDGSGSDKIYKLDPTTGQGTIVANPGFEFIFGLVYLNNQLYGFTAGGQVIVIDLVSGKGTAVASFTPGFNGATSF